MSDSFLFDAEVKNKKVIESPMLLCLSPIQRGRFIVAPSGTIGSLRHCSQLRDCYAVNFVTVVRSTSCGSRERESAMSEE